MFASAKGKQSPQALTARAPRGASENERRSSRNRKRALRKTKVCREAIPRLDYQSLFRK